jgi:hypothetical protein
MSAWKFPRERGATDPRSPRDWLTPQQSRLIECAMQIESQPLVDHQPPGISEHRDRWCGIGACPIRRWSGRSYETHSPRDRRWSTTAKGKLRVGAGDRHEQHGVCD